MVTVRVLFVVRRMRTALVQAYRRSRNPSRPNLGCFGEVMQHRPIQQFDSLSCGGGLHCGAQASSLHVARLGANRVWPSAGSKRQSAPLVAISRHRSVTIVIVWPLVGTWLFVNMAVIVGCQSVRNDNKIGMDRKNGGVPATAQSEGVDRDNHMRLLPIVAWTRRFGGEHDDGLRFMLKTQADGLVAVGQKDNLGYIVKVTNNGDTRWEKIIGDRQDVTECIYACEAKGRSIVVVRQTREKGGVDVHPHLLGISEEGEVIWEKRLNFYVSNSHDVCYIGEFCPAELLLVANTRNEDGRTPIVLYGLGERGELKWQKEQQNKDDDSAMACCPTAENGVLIAGDTTAIGGHFDVCYSKYNQSGECVWRKVIKNSRNGIATSIVGTADGGSVLCGWYGSGFSMPGNSAFLAKLDGEGNVVWSKTYNSACGDSGRWVTECLGGGYAFCGITCTRGNSWDIFVSKVDGSGDLIWRKEIGYQGNDYGMVITETEGGKLVVAGSMGEGGEKGFGWSDGFTACVAEKGIK